MMSLSPSLPNELLFLIIQNIYYQPKNLIELFRLRRVNRQFNDIANYAIKKLTQIRIPQSMIYRHRRVLKFYSQNYHPVGFYYDSTIQQQEFCDLMTEIMESDRIKTMMHCIKIDQNQSFFFMKPIAVGLFQSYVGFCHLSLKNKNVFMFRKSESVYRPH